MGKLTVIIPSRNDENFIACLAAVSEHEPDLEVIVVDDGLTVAPHRYGATGIHGIKPFIFARNINIGIRAAGDSDVILLNDDALLETPGGFTAMQRACVAKSYALLSPVVRGPSNLSDHKSSLGPGEVREIPRTIPFICVFIPRVVIDAIGLLDERYDCYGGDDDDYSYRVRFVGGGRIGIFGGCQVDHGSLKSTFRPDGRGLPIGDAQRIFREIHGFEMATR